MGASPAQAEPGCPHLGETAGRYIDEAKLCANMQQEMQNWLLTGSQPDFGRAVRGSVKGGAAEVAPEQKPGITRLPETVKPPETEARKRPKGANTSEARRRPVGGRDHKVKVNRVYRHDREATAHDVNAVAVVSERQKDQGPAPIREVAIRRTRDAERPAAVAERTPPARGKRGIEAQATAAAVPERPVVQPLARTSERSASSPLSPLTIPAGLGVVLMLAVTYRWRRRLVADATVWWRRTRLTREGDRLIRMSMATDTLPLTRQSENCVPEQQAVAQVPEAALKHDLEQGSSNLSYVFALSALHGMGLTGPGADDVARAVVVELLTAQGIASRVLMPHEDMVRLFGEEATGVEIPGLVVLGSLRDVVTELEVEIIRRTGQRTDSGVPEGLPWLFVVASVGAAAERLYRIVEGGAEDLILGAFLDAWPYGITCMVDDSGVISSLEGCSAPAWTGRRLSAWSKSEAAERLAALAETA
ncbi:hypothetical protein N5079_32585 [Planotetraspora sp. A-T 1434]|uniref:hypothetical protein n=1 Tax=Planotetraspora sp. A-T 1434 TaxID=2979219 RepID=UPI0021BFE0F3|nr:hypothetical protein [Planotetraspora sp. A-T 1434]MCT9934955.1 hypothetical protein [Planotetraspora sp. A-T 1434]